MMMSIKMTCEIYMYAFRDVNHQLYRRKAHYEGENNLLVTLKKKFKILKLTYNCLCLS